MQGTIRINANAGFQSLELPRYQTWIVPMGGGGVELRGQGPGLPVLWDSRRSLWIIPARGGDHEEVTINGRGLKAEEDTALHHLDVVAFLDVSFQLVLLLEDPVRGGERVNEIVLGKAPVTFGSAREVSSDWNRISLDAEDLRISRDHAVVLMEGSHYVLEDKSRLGTELNGVAFRREKLVFGDRFRISGYIFEFTGASIRRIRPELSGSIEVRNLVKVAGGRRILDDVSLNIAAGEFIGVLGRSGQGKSTFLTAVCGISPASSGETRIGDVPLTDRQRLQELGIGYVPQDDIVHRELTVLDAVTFSARLRLKLERHLIADLVERVLDRLGLTQHALKRVALLSGGQRKRVSIAIELLSKPSVLFLDEPSSGLDPATEAELMTLLQSLTLTKLTVVCTTHVLHKAYLFDRLLVIEGGKLIFAGSGDEARTHFLMRGGGDSSEALDRAPLEKIYSLLQENEKLGGKSAAVLEQEFLNSPFGVRAYPPVPRQLLSESSSKISKRSRVGAVETFKILAQRQWSILRADPLNLAFLASQPLLIGFFVGWASEESALRMFLCIVATMWFGCSNGAQQIVSELAIFRRERVCGLGLNAYILSKVGFLSIITLTQAVLLLFSTVSSAKLFHPSKTDFRALVTDFTRRMTPPLSLQSQEDSLKDFGAVGEEDRRSNASESGSNQTARSEDSERQVKLPNKWLVLGVAGFSEFFQISQNILDSGPRVLMGSDGNPIRDREGKEIGSPGVSLFWIFSTSVGLRFLAIAGAAIVSVGIGLSISALVENTTQAVLWVPLVLIPQILFGGIVVRVPDMSAGVRAFSKIMPSFSAQRIADVSAIFGQDTPSMSNRTKIPVFLSSMGEKDTVTWREGEDTKSQDYDRVSEENTAWQNLTVLVDQVGAHKWEKVSGGGDDPVYPDSVSKRRDVRLRKGMSYWDLAPFRSAAFILSIWFVLCYATALLGLDRKQTGR